MASVQTGIRPALSSPYQATTAVAELVSCNSTRSPGSRPELSSLAATASERTSSSR